MSEPKFVTFGCRLNTYETEVMRNHAEAAGKSNAIVFNTCAVTAEATRQARQAIRKAKAENPDAEIIVTGCAAQTDPEMFAKMPEVSRVLGNEEKLKLSSWQHGANARVSVSDIMEVKAAKPHLVDGLKERTRAFVQVQNGCDHRCTFCVIPYGRGNSRSVPMGAVVQEARRLVEKGFAEIVLTGVDLTSYGADLPGSPGLGALGQKILKLLPELKRLRLSSIDSIEADALLMRMIADEERLMPHFHLSVQSGDDLILKRMKRRHSRADTIAFCDAVRRVRPDAAFGADFIAGFPTESEAMFAGSLALVDDAGLSSLHVFPYSARPGTPAARMPQQSRTTVKERAARLRAKGEAAQTARLDAMAGSLHTVLVERGDIGRTPCFTPVALPKGLTPGSLARIAVTGRSRSHLTGVPQ